MPMSQQELFENNFEQDQSQMTNFEYNIEQENNEEQILTPFWTKSQ